MFATLWLKAALHQDIPHHAASPAALLQLVALEIEPYMAEFAGPYFAASGLAGRIRPMIGPAQDSMLKLAEQGERCAVGGGFKSSAPYAASLFPQSYPQSA
jgi:predicted O-methyltransferase YrrM